MDRRDFLKVGAATAVASTVAMPSRLLAAGDATLWDRPVHITYVGSGGKSFGNEYTDAQVVNRLKQVTGGGCTAVTPFFLNAGSAGSYDNIIGDLNTAGISIVPGVGKGPDQGLLSDPTYKNIAQIYSRFTNFIRLENCQGHYDAHGKTAIQNMIDYLQNSLGFTHIMLNPWPQTPDHQAVKLTGTALKSSFNNVNPNTWLLNDISWQPLVNNKQSLKIVVEYESEPEHLALSNMEKRNPGSSITAMNKAANQCQNNAGNLYWCPPWTQVYDAPALGTWSWIANRLSQMP